MYFNRVGRDFLVKPVNTVFKHVFGTTWPTRRINCSSTPIPARNQMVFPSICTSRPVVSNDMLPCIINSAERRPAGAQQRTRAINSGMAKGLTR